MRTEPGNLAPLPAYLRTGLRLLFVGYNPGITSARLAHYYAHPGNAFWRHLAASGLAPAGVGHTDDARLFAEEGIGFIDLVRRPSLRASELTGEELAAGALRLHGEIACYQPGVVVFSGKGIFAEFGRHALGLARRDAASRRYGEQRERIGDSRLWTVPSSSGLASRWHAERLELLRELSAQLDRA